jgi:hypothetical protein
MMRYQLARPQRGTDEHNNITSDKQHANFSCCFLGYFFLRLIVDFGCCDRLLNVSKDHI